MPRGITIQELAPKLNRTSADLVRILFDAGEMVTGTQSMADEMIELIAQELGAEVLLVEPGQEAELELQAMLGDDDGRGRGAARRRARRSSPSWATSTTARPRCSTGSARRTSSRVRPVASPSTSVRTRWCANERPITFIDTPGHEAFTAMRARGAEATDVAVLVVAADDGVMPQTIEAINHARAAEVPIVVAITKIDRENADAEPGHASSSSSRSSSPRSGAATPSSTRSPRPRASASTSCSSRSCSSPTSTTRRSAANPKAPARAFVLESNLDQGRGPVATVLVERGTLRVGDPVVAGGGWGKVRAMFDDTGSQVTEAGPSTPVEVLGLDDVPLAGDELRVAPNEKIARTVAEARSRRRRAPNLRPTR